MAIKIGPILINMLISSGDNYLVINYHYVRHYDPRYGGIHPCSPEDLDKQLKFLSQSFNIVSLPEVVGAAAAQKDGKFCAVTFDDGLKDHYHNAAAILARHKTPATFFIITGTWHGLLPAAHRIHLMLSRFSINDLISKTNQFLNEFHPSIVAQYQIPFDRRLSTLRGRWDTIPVANFKEIMANLPSEIADEFFGWFSKKQNINDDSLIDELFMSQSEVAELTKRGHDIGAHTYDHRAFNSLTVDAIVTSIIKSRDDLAGILPNPPLFFSYPQGVSSKETMVALKEAGFAYACTTERRGLRADDSPLLIPRYDANDLQETINANSQSH